MSTTPLVSVILPFYNSSKTVVRAAQNMLRQTVKDIEVIAIDDGSADCGFARMQSLRDPRLRLYRNERNLGASAARNRGLEHARGEYVAMMDADDTCHPRRLEWTLAALCAHTEAGVCGGWMRMYRRGTLPYVLRQPCRANAVRAMTLYGPPFCGASIMIRRAWVADRGLRYNESLVTGGDDDFCSRLLRHTQGMNIPRVVYYYRWNPAGLTAHARPAGRMRRAESLRAGLEKLLARRVSMPELTLHARIGTGEGVRMYEDLIQVRDWLRVLTAANADRRVFDQAALEECTAMIWFRVCRNSAHLGFPAWHAWRNSVFATGYKPYADEIFGYAGSMLKCFLMRAVAPPRKEGAT